MVLETILFENDDQEESGGRSDAVPDDVIPHAVPIKDPDEEYDPVSTPEQYFNNPMQNFYI